MSIKRAKQDIDYFSTGTPVQTPADLPNLLFWLDATDVNGTGSNPADGTAVANWVDKSGNGFNFSRIDALQSPILQATGFNSRPTVRIDPTMDGFQADPSFASPTGSYTIFMVGRQLETNIGGFNAYLFDLNGTDRFLIWLNDDDSAGFYYQNAFQGTLIQEGGLVYATWIFDEARNPTAELRINGISVRTNANFVNTDLTANARIGSRFTAEDPANFDGFLSEFFFYNRTLSSLEINLVEEYLKNKWGL